MKNTITVRRFTSITLSCVLLAFLAAARIFLSDTAIAADNNPATPARMEGKQKFAPNQAVVLDPVLMWAPTPWAGRHTDVAWVEVRGASPQFFVGEAGKRKVWVRYLDLPIDAKHFP